MAMEKQLREQLPASRAAALAGRWRNQLGSVMELELDPGSHALRGTYRTGVGSPVPEQVYAVSGFAAGDAFVFAVDFTIHGSVGSWAGHHVADGAGERLVSLWHLARPVAAAHDEGDVWGAVLAGADEFHRLA